MSNFDPHDRPLRDSGRDDLLIQQTDDGSMTLVQSATGNGFHSASGAAAETREVYLGNSGVQARLESREPTRVLEVGLGTGLGMLMTVDAAITHSAKLVYHAVETDWLPSSVLARLDMDQWLKNTGLLNEYIVFRDRCRIESGTETPRFVWKPTSAVEVVIHWGDVRDWCPAQDDRAHRERFDAVYFDPFAPHSAPALWETEVLAKMHKALQVGGKLATYCCSRAVRDRLADVGFEVCVLRGPVRGKRNVLVAKRVKP